ncbi:MAG: DUF882 domain-containing protein [Hyphomicrobiales bacterium]|nr:DUF882 domain-containing protein [Hyphomicrobiales bacterium]
MAMRLRNLAAACATALIAAAGVVCVGLLAQPQRLAASDERAIALYNIHTKENLTLVFKRDGKFIPEALDKFNHFMRDWRRNVSTTMDPQLLDLMWEIHRELRSQRPIYIISGHRSSATNERMRRAGGGQAKASRHVTGQAADIHFPDVHVKQLRNSALVREKGGVGYYPTSAIPFVHVDTGNVRHWPRLPRQELAILFPSGRSKHTPTDGKPLTREDFRFALAKLESSGGTLPIVTQRLLNRLPAAEPRPILASLGPTNASFGKPSKDDAPELPKPVIVRAPEPKPEADLAPPASVVTQPTPAARPPRSDYSPGFVTAGLPRNERAIAEDQIARAPEYDDDHPDEESYQPFPILPLLTDEPLAYADFSKESRAVVRKVHMLFTDPNAAIHVELERGPQYEGMYWAQRFTGAAVSGTMTKFMASEATSSTVTKTAASPSAPQLKAAATASMVGR